MRHPSKRTALIAEADRRRRQAFHENDIVAFAAAVEEIKAHEASPDTYTCIQCGNDFGDGAHVDLLVASALIFGDDGQVIPDGRFDYGLREVQKAKERGDHGRRIKICGKCIKKWKIPLSKYLEMR